MIKYRVYATKTHDLISTKEKQHILGHFIMYLNVASDDLYQKMCVHVQALKFGENLMLKLCSPF